MQYYIVYENNLDYERSPIPYASDEVARAEAARGISSGAGWSGFHIVNN